MGGAGRSRARSGEGMGGGAELGAAMGWGAGAAQLGGGVEGGQEPSEVIWILANLGSRVK